MATIHGTSSGDTLHGTSGNDSIYGYGGEDVLDGWAGDDYIESFGATGLANINGQRGDDTLVGSVPGSGQLHMRGASGDDVIRMDVTNTSGHQGHHAYGGLGSDTFEFINVAAAVSPILGRIDDFDLWQDEIWIEGVQIDLYNLPEGVDVVTYLGQQWLRIGDTVIYALEGARDGGAERHFSEMPADIGALTPVEFIDQKNFVPLPEYQASLSGLTLVETKDATFVGTSAADLIEGDKIDQTIDGGDGNDVINAGKGHDSVDGGAGNDHIAGGVDDDTIQGGVGDDMLWGGSENDSLIGGDGNDYIEGGTGGDVIYGDEFGMSTAYLGWLADLEIG